MTIAAVKEKLHHYIDEADGKRAKAMLELIEGELSGKEYEVSDETMNMLNERWEEYITGKVQTFTAEESMARIRKQRSERNGI